MSDILKIAFTGHRHLQYKEVHPMLTAIHEKYPGAIWITGGAIGLDTAAAMYAMTHDIELWLILPFPPAVMSARWTQAQTAFLKGSVKYATKFSVLGPVFSMAGYQARNERMVDLSDIVAAFYDGTPGGTANCVRYARRIGKEVFLPNNPFCFAAFPSPSTSSPILSGYHEVQGDIFTSPAQAIVNTVNCVGVMGKGIALEYKKRYPKMYEAYRKACSIHAITPGNIWVYKADDGKIIFNCAVKDHWQNPSKLEWIDSCLHKLLGGCRAEGITSLSLPWMGAYNGQIPIDRVKAVTREVLSKVTDIDISVYEIRNV